MGGAASRRVGGGQEGGKDGQERGICHGGEQESSVSQGAGR